MKTKIYYSIFILFLPMLAIAFFDSTSSDIASSGITQQAFKAANNVELACNTGGWKTKGVVVSCEGKFSMCQSSGDGKKNQTQSGTVAGIQVSQEMHDCMNKVIPNCLKSLGCSGENAKIHAMGGHADRKTNTPSGQGKSASKHCGGNAIDVDAIECDNKTLKCTEQGFSSDKNSYNAFRECMNKEIEKNCKSSGHSDSKLHSIGTPGSIEKANSKHRDHCHFSIDTPFNDSAI